MGGVGALGEETALDFLSERHPISGEARVRELGGGVSNNVFLVEDRDSRIVLKQSIPRLRVRDEWLADRSRIFREWEVMQALRAILPEGRLPGLLFVDEPRFLYAMSAAPPDSSDWKSRLLSGDCSVRTARLAGTTLGLLARGTWESDEFRDRFSDRSAFEQLRTDPYYRTVGIRHPRLRQQIEDWIAESSRRQVAIVHGDWSPKNLLVSRDGIVCIDFECAHFGDPSYDAGFMLNHLLLKAFHRPQLAASYLYLARVTFGWTVGLLPAVAVDWFEAASVRHLGFLMLARVDGKSPVEYLSDEKDCQAVRQLALDLIERRPRTLEESLSLAARSLTQFHAGLTRRRLA